MMKIVMKIALGLLVIAVIAFGLWMALIFKLGCNHHPGPEMTIYNEFNESVGVSLNGVNMGKIEAHSNEIFYPSENRSILIGKTYVLVEVKSMHDITLYSKEFSIDELNSMHWRLIISPNTR